MSTGSTRQAHAERCRRRIETDWRDTVKAEAEKRTKEYLDRAADGGTKSAPEEGEHEQAATTVRMETKTVRTSRVRVRAAAATQERE